MSSTRRLAAILAADVAGYSRLMGRDEEGTLRRLQAHQRELIDPKIAGHRGRLVKTTGDGMLVEFASVVDAVRCAVEVQRGMVERNAEVSGDERIEFRVGINLGDIIVEADDIFGDGVNIAARLEALAEPGGICVSRTVRNQVRDKLPYEFEDIGEQAVKNIARPVRADRISSAVIATTPLVPVQAPAATPPRRRSAARNAVIAASLAALLALIALGGWWLWPRQAESPKQAGAPSTSAAIAPRLSIVVLPFANLSSDPEQDYFVDAVTDDLTTDLSRIANSFVIARTTAFTYKEKPVDVKQIGRDLGVRYVLEGSVRRLGEQVQVNVQLIDAESGAHVWADRFDTDRRNRATAQSEITARLARTLHLELLEAVGRQIEHDKSADLDAEDFLMRGWAWYYRPTSETQERQALQAFEKALAIDPTSVGARVGIAHVLLDYVFTGWSKSRTQDMARADQLLNEAVELDRNYPRANLAIGMLRRLQGRLIESKIHLEKERALNPNDAGAMMQLGWTLMSLAKPEEALPLVEQGLRLNPRHSNVFYYLLAVGTCHLFLGHLDEAIDFLTQARAADATFFHTRIILAAALGLKGDIDGARIALAELHKLKPELISIAVIKKMYEVNSLPETVALRDRTFYAGLRRAGMPEE